MSCVPSLGSPLHPLALQLGWAPQPWLGEEGASWRDGHHSPAKSRRQGPLGYQMLPSAPGLGSHLPGLRRGEGPGAGSSAAGRAGGGEGTGRAGSTRRVHLGEEHEGATRGPTASAL